MVLMAMKRGDVFKRAGDSSSVLFLTESVAANGVIHARRYDLSAGAFGDALRFSSAGECQVLFNEDEPEDEPDARYAHIVHRVEPQDEQNGKEWFEAVVDDAAGDLVLRCSQPVSYTDGEPKLALTPRGEGGKLFGWLVRGLELMGWQPVMEKRSAWFTARLKYSLPYDFVRIRREALARLEVRAVTAPAAPNNPLRFASPPLRFGSGPLRYSLYLDDLASTSGLSIYSHLYISDDARYLQIVTNRRFMGDTEHETTSLHLLASGARLFSCSRADVQDAGISPDGRYGYVLCSGFPGPAALTLVIELPGGQVIEERADNGALFHTSAYRCTVAVHPFEEN